MPRRDGQYSNHSTDVLALLDEAGVAVDYATDPIASGVHAEKSADAAILAASELMSTLLNARANPEVVVHKGQKAIIRLHRSSKARAGQFISDP